MNWKTAQGPAAMAAVWGLVDWKTKGKMRTAAVILFAASCVAGVALAQKKAAAK